MTLAMEQARLFSADFALPWACSGNPLPRVTLVAASFSGMRETAWEKGLFSALAPEEALYIRRFRLPSERRARLLGRGLLFLVLRSLGYKGKTIRIQRERYGQPLLADSELRVSLSYCSGVAVAAAARGCAAGVDVEAEAPLAPEEVRHALSGPEAARIQENRLPASLVSCWTAKEAVLKGTGTGFARGPGNGDLFAPVPESGGAPWHVIRYRLRFSRAGQKHVLALACDAPRILVRWLGPRDLSALTSGAFALRQPLEIFPLKML